MIINNDDCGDLPTHEEIVKLINESGGLVKYKEEMEPTFPYKDLFHETPASKKKQTFIGKKSKCNGRKRRGF